MAATGYTPIQPYYSTTATNVPLAANMVTGELAINTVDGKLYYKNSAGVVTLLATAANSGGTFAAITNTSLTAGRVVYSGTGGLEVDSANLTFSGTVLTVTGSITATADSTFSSTGALTISKGTTAQQPASPVTGMIRYNTTSNQFEGYAGSSPSWLPVGGSVISNDTSTASNLYPVFANATSGTATTVYTSNAKYLYKPSTGDLQASQVIASNGLHLNANTNSTSYTIATGNSAMSVGPFTVATGTTITVSSGSRWVIL